MYYKPEISDRTSQFFWKKNETDYEYLRAVRFLFYILYTRPKCGFW